MADLDEMSMMLGEIRAGVAHSIEWMERHEKADQERFDKLATRLDVNNGYRFRLEAIEDTLEVQKPVFEQAQRLKWVAAGFVAAASVMGGVIVWAAGQVSNFLR